MCYMRTISQRELRNDNAEVVRAVEAGESFVITRRGVPVARLVPLDAARRAEPRRSARRAWSGRARVTSSQTTADVLAALRAE